IGGGAALQALELFLDPDDLGREEAVAEPFGRDAEGGGALREDCGAAARLAGADGRAAEHDPVECDPPGLFEEVEERAPAAGLDGVGVRAQAKDAEGFAGAAGELEAQHRSRQLFGGKTGRTGRPSRKRSMPASSACR